MTASRAYFCLNCQTPVEMKTIQAGGHQSHLLTELECAQETTDSSIVSMMRKFREKVEQARRYRHLWRGAGL